jgi:UDP-N-acetyl-D-glucosamine/UDP-N-acetyl-D-galactosamine dehydrogenase
MLNNIACATVHKDNAIMKEKISVIGLGYVGLPVAVALAQAFPGTVGFDISARRIATLQKGQDWTGEIEPIVLQSCGLTITGEGASLAGTTFFIVTVPTPIDADRRPDLSPLESACKIIAPVLQKGAVVVFESTVYPGVTENFCGPLLEKYSGLKQGHDFKLGYSPERINPGDKLHRLETITKIIAAEDAATLDRLRRVYGSIIKAGLFEATSIKVAEAAKVLENTQRDINIALMNELSIILDRLNIRTKDVLDAAGTKWNFLRFTPGLVGGHCIGVDPYYLTSCAEALGYHPQVILAGRRLNDDMGRFIASKLIKLLVQAGKPVNGAKVGVLGLTFKENVPDLRNSKVPDIIRELKEFGINPLVHDPLADAHGAQEEYGLDLAPMSAFTQLDAIVLAVSHRETVQHLPMLLKQQAKGCILIDVKSAVTPESLPAGMHYWSL